MELHSLKCSIAKGSERGDLDLGRRDELRSSEGREVEGRREGPK